MRDSGSAIVHDRGLLGVPGSRETTQLDARRCPLCGAERADYVRAGDGAGVPSVERGRGDGGDIARAMAATARGDVAPGAADDAPDRRFGVGLILAIVVSLPMWFLVLAVVGLV